MNFSNVPANGAIRLWLKGEQLTKRIPVKSINTSPMEYVNNKLKTLSAKSCTVEVLAKAGNSFLSIGKFDYPTGPLSTDNKTYTGSNVLHSSQQDRRTYLEYDGVLAKHYEKLYNEEAEKCRKFRIELDKTTHELTITKSELHFIGERNELENMIKDLEREREHLERERNAKGGLGGLMDTIEKNTFLQGLIEKVIDNYFNKPKEGLNGISNIDDPDIKQAITGITNALVKIGAADKEHFGYSSLVIDKINSDKDMAKYLYRWMNTPQEPSVTSKTSDKPNSSYSNVL
ncbi:MAG TPA: hypothetical protein VEC12_02695 [Bacteroidia bacterium]|nr:hypothetical protein [Bacteroidia bacterium]